MKPTVQLKMVKMANYLYNLSQYKKAVSVSKELKTFFFLRLRYTHTHTTPQIVKKNYFNIKVL